METRYYACHRSFSVYLGPEASPRYAVFRNNRFQSSDKAVVDALESNNYFNKTYWRTTEDGVPLDNGREFKPAPRDWDQLVSIDMPDGRVRRISKGDLAKMLNPGKPLPEEVEEVSLNGLDLQALREDVGLSKAAMAEKLGVSTTLYRNAEKNLDGLPPKVLTALETVEIG